MKQTGLSPNTIYPIVRGQAKAVSLETLGTLAAGIEALTGERPGIADLLEIVEPQPEVNPLLAELLRTAKPPLSAEALLGPQDWTTEELEAHDRAELEIAEEKKILRSRRQTRERVFLKSLTDDTDQHQ
jgi:hypothetical protein